jgi:molybdopterin-guanine dinucleotide biosynthesis protein A
MACAADCPFIPAQLVSMLAESGDLSHVDVICPQFNGRKQFLASLWHRSVQDKITAYLEADGRSVKGLLATLRVRYVDILNKSMQGSEAKPSDFDPFFNINTRADLELANTFKVSR